MIKIIFYRDKCSKELTGFKSEGHAGYADSGKDIICAAVSVLVINTVNSIEQFTDDLFEGSSDENNASICFMITDKHSQESLLLLKSLELGLTQIAKDSPDYISITFKEV